MRTLLILLRTEFISLVNSLNRKGKTPFIIAAIGLAILGLFMIGMFAIIGGSTTYLLVEKDLAEYAISFTSTFANYISQDAGDRALDKYFPSGSQTLSYIKRNSSRDLYTRHGSVSINNEEIKDCIVFSDDVVYMEVYVEQWMEMYWGSDEPEVLPTDAHVYFVKIDGKWYVGGIQY